MALARPLRRCREPRLQNTIENIRVLRKKNEFLDLKRCNEISSNNHNKKCIEMEEAKEIVYKKDRC